jgi:hypothetical protein
VNVTRRHLVERVENHAIPPRDDCPREGPRREYVRRQLQ